MKYLKQLDNIDTKLFVIGLASLIIAGASIGSCRNNKLTRKLLEERLSTKVEIMDTTNNSISYQQYLDSAIKYQDPYYFLKK